MKEVDLIKILADFVKSEDAHIDEVFELLQSQVEQELCKD